MIDDGLIDNGTLICMNSHIWFDLPECNSTEEYSLSITLNGKNVNELLSFQNVFVTTPCGQAPNEASCIQATH
jgi:hypothetical protein